MRLMGMFTSPKLIEPLQIERAIPALVFTSRASRNQATVRRQRYDPVTGTGSGVTREGARRAERHTQTQIVTECSPFNRPSFKSRSDDGQVQITHGRRRCDRVRQLLEGEALEPD